MSFLDPYVTLTPEGFSFSRLQASRFAKQIADDYNPIHDVDAKRFCVPGDLLFALLLTRKGLYPRMHFDFSGMVGDGTALRMEASGPGGEKITDVRGKEYLHASFSGDPSHDPKMIEEFIRSYVRFSGHNFPHILEPLMAENQVMINVDRPLVIYESMTIDLTHEEKMRAPTLEFAGATLEVAGKRGNAILNFTFFENGETVGSGEKRMVLSGLRPYDADTMRHMVHLYDERKRKKVE